MLLHYEDAIRDMYEELSYFQGSFEPSNPYRMSLQFSMIHVREKCRSCGCDAYNFAYYGREGLELDQDNLCTRCYRVEQDYRYIYDYDEFDDDWDDGWDDFEMALQDCGMVPGEWFCLLGGTEYCDFECPFRDKPLSWWTDEEE